jgi:hypothetical protein
MIDVEMGRRGSSIERKLSKKAIEPEIIIYETKRKSQP